MSPSLGLEKFRKHDSTIPLVSRGSDSKSRNQWPVGRSGWKQWLFSDSWTIEFVAAAVAAASLASIGITLGVYNHLPVADWPHSIKLNTVLQILSTMLKGSMLVSVCACLSQLKWLWYTRHRPLGDFEAFDSASRGPLGAVKLLYRLKCWHLASIGSFVTLLALLSDAFIQQSVSYPLKTVAQRDGLATVPYTQNYTQIGGGDGEPAYINQLMLAAVYAGVFSTKYGQTMSAVIPICTTGNCTFPAFASLAVCSNCANVTRLLNHTALPDTGLGPSDTWTLPNGQSIANIETGIEAISMNASSFEQQLPLNSDELHAYASTLGAITNITILVEGPMAWDCVLYFCASSYNFSEVQGADWDVTLDTFDKPEWYSTADGIAFDVPETSLTGIGNQSRTFTISQNAMYATKKSIGKSLVGGGGSSSGDVEEFSSDVAQGFVYRTNNVTHPDSVVMSIAIALTNNLRDISDLAMTGTAWTMKNYVKVEWIWLLLPLIMIILALVFLISTVLQSQRSEVPSWRESVLAVMEHGVNTTMGVPGNVDESNDTSTIGRGREKPSDLTSWAEDVTVFLRGTGAYGKGRSGYQLTVLNGQNGTDRGDMPD